MEDLGEDDDQVLELLKALADEPLHRILRTLMQGPRTQVELEDPNVKGLDQSGVSRKLDRLRLLGVVVGHGREEIHRVDLRDEIYAVIRAVEALAEARNRSQQDALARSRRRRAKERMKGADQPEGTEHDETA